MVLENKQTYLIYFPKPTFCCSSEHVSANLHVLSGYISITLFSIISNYLCANIFILWGF